MSPIAIYYSFKQVDYNPVQVLFVCPGCLHCEHSFGARLRPSSRPAPSPGRPRRFLILPPPFFRGGALRCSSALRPEVMTEG